MSAAEALRAKTEQLRLTRCHPPERNDVENEHAPL